MRALATLFMLLLMSLTAAAGERVALVIGSPAFQGSQRIASAEGNAALIAHTLRDMSYDVVELRGPGRLEAIRAVRDLMERTRGDKDDVFIFYYCGYALDVDGRNFLLLSDSSTGLKSDVEDTGLSLERILRDIGDRSTLVLLDARSIPTDFPDDTLGATRGLARVEPASGTIISMASRPGTVASDGNGANSVYAEALARALPQPGAGIATVLQNVDRHVADITGGRQRPWVQGALDRDFVLTPGAPSAELPPDPVPLPPSPVAPSIIERYPTLDAPDTAVAGATVTVSVALTEDLQTPDVQARAALGQTLSASGALRLALPEPADEWPIDMDFFAPGFDLVQGEWGARVAVPRSGDSDVARFQIRARDIKEAETARRLTVRFYHQGKFLGSATRPITVLRETSSSAAMVPASPPQPEETLIGELSIGSRLDVPDLDVTILYDDPDKLGPARISIHSPHIAAPLQDTFSTPPEMAAWLQHEYRRLVDFSRNARSATPLESEPATSEEQQAEYAARGFGDLLYKRYVPEAFKAEFWRLKRRGVLKSIQITSNSTLFPWELVRPMSADGKDTDDFLGIAYRVARWAPRTIASQEDSPLNRMIFSGVAAVAPDYAAQLQLPYQQSEIDALRQFSGFKLFGGDFLSFETLLKEVSSGFVHFSGHGAVNPPGSGLPIFSIELTNASLDPAMWSALNAAVARKGRPFYFFNACDTGQSSAMGGFVDGWGPAVLESGASGFIGGMWPLTDRTAAAFSIGFYAEIARGLSRGPVYLADVLRDMRRKFHETGDPTYLGYAFYGNANLQITAK